MRTLIYDQFGRQIDISLDPSDLPISLASWRRRCSPGDRKTIRLEDGEYLTLIAEEDIPMLLRQQAI